jgi:hypothetical protein
VSRFSVGEYGKPTRDQIGYFRLVRRHRVTCHSCCSFFFYEEFYGDF